MIKNRMRKAKDPTHLNGLYTPFVSPVPGGQKPLVRGGVERPIPTFPPEGRSCKLTNTSC